MATYTDRKYDHELKLYGTMVPESVIQGIAACYEKMLEVFGYEILNTEVTHGIFNLQIKKRKK